MGYTTPDVYYQPEAFGLTLVAEVDFADSYEYDIAAVWRDSNGALFFGTDSGCSCTTPFDSCTDLSSLTPVSSLADIAAKMGNRLRNGSTDQYRATQLLGRVAALI